MTETVEIEVSSEKIAREIRYGIVQRAQAIHNDPGDENEGVAVELRDIGQNIVERYE